MMSPNRTKRVSVKTGNAVRTTMQAGPAWAITEGVDAWFYDMNDRQFGITVILLTMLFAYLQPILENFLGRAVMRNPYVEDVPVTTKVATPTVVEGGTTPQS